jgi:hypothetical protein
MTAKVSESEGERHDGNMPRRGPNASFLGMTPKQKLNLSHTSISFL